MNVDIAERLAKRRREAGYSQESLAEKLGVSRQAVSKWERSESSPDTDNLIALAQLYGVSLDELLYVDETLQDDVEFEAADRAAERKTGAGAQADSQTYTQDSATNSAPQAETVEGAEYSAAQADTSSENNAASGQTSEAKKGKFNIGFDGIHINDGDDYVHVSWRDGVHVKDSKDDNEVHVGWDGVHVKEGKKKGDWFSAGDDEGNTVSWDEDAVIINGREYSSWREAHNDWHEGKKKAKAWIKFPFYLVAIIAYILLGTLADAWGVGLFVFFTIPVYYMLVHAIVTKKFAPFFAGLYPLASIAWFLYMAFILNQPHPAWVIFLTIPVVEWLVHSISRANKRRKKKDTAIEGDVIEVEAVEADQA